MAETEAEAECDVEILLKRLCALADAAYDEQPDYYNEICKLPFNEGTKLVKIEGIDAMAKQISENIPSDEDEFQDEFCEGLQAMEMWLTYGNSNITVCELADIGGDPKYSKKQKVWEHIFQNLYNVMNQSRLINIELSEVHVDHRPIPLIKDQLLQFVIAYFYFKSESESE
jgi:hypothetical protein